MSNLTKIATYIPAKCGDLVNYVDSPEDLRLLEQAYNDPKAVPMPPHIRKRIEQIFNLPPVYRPDEPKQLTVKGNEDGN